MDRIPVQHVTNDLNSPKTFHLLQVDERKEADHLIRYAKEHRLVEVYCPGDPRVHDHALSISESTSLYGDVHQGRHLRVSIQVQLHPPRFHDFHPTLPSSQMCTFDHLLDIT